MHHGKIACYPGDKVMGSLPHRRQARVGGAAVIAVTGSYRRGKCDALARELLGAWTPDPDEGYLVISEREK
jgi:hypothetical protein